MNIGPILNGYGAIEIWTSRWFKIYVENQGYSWDLQHEKLFQDVPSSVYFTFIYCFPYNPILGNLGEVRPGDRNEKFCWQPRPNHRSGNWLFRYSVTFLLKCGMPLHTGNTCVTVFCVVEIIFNFYWYLGNSWESVSSTIDFSDT
jgi:hypothetical protein